MSKKSKSRKNTARSGLFQNRNILFSAAALLVMVFVGFMLINGSNNPSAATAPNGDTAASVTQIRERISPADYQQAFSTTDKEHLLLDVRTPAEFASGHIAGAVNISVETLASRLSEVPADQPVVVYCRSGNRSATASQILADAGYSEIYDLGGITTWTAQGLPIE